MDETKGGFDREIAVRPIAGAVAVLAVVVVVSMILMGMMLRRSQESARLADPPPPAMVEAAEAAPPPAPRLQQSPPVDLGIIRTQETFMLENYGWVDRPAGLARIPIGKAMEILAASGLPVREEPPAAPAAASAPVNNTTEAAVR